MVINRHKPAGDWKDPKKHKPQLRRDFAYTCAYSWVHERPLGGAATFEVEHFRPEGRKEFEHLRSVYANLYYVWGPCNRAKGKSWPSPDEAEKGFRFIDPCEECSFIHLTFELAGGRFTGGLVGCTPAGRYTILKCALNNEVLRDLRRKQTADLARVEKLLRRLEAVLDCEALSDDQRQEIEAERVNARALKLEIIKPQPLPLDNVTPDAEDGH